MASPSLQQAYGYELQFFTNHVGHFILVTELLKQLSPQGRVVVVSSAAHAAAPRGKGIDFDNLSGDVDYRPWTAYGQSKLANLLFANELSRRLPQPNQTANSLHPGVIRTNLVRNLPTIVQLGATLIAPLGWKTIEQGAATQCYLASQPTLTTTGNYYADCNVAKSSPFGRDTALAARLWEVSEGIASGL
jgi:NAD(P)-dependent dehydrogenase (short-subunit alcohol dehydrogenase family)